MIQILKRKCLIENKKKGFSLMELIIVIAIMLVLLAILVPSLIHYTEKSRAQKDVSTMDEVVNAVQLAMSDSNCYDEMLLYACDNNYLTYTDSSGKYGQQIIDAEYWAPDGYGRATTITFNPEKNSQGDTIYRLENAIVNDMTYGNRSIGQPRIMEGAKKENQCLLPNAKLSDGQDTGYLYNRVRQTIGNSVVTTSATYANSSFTIFIKFSQKDGVTVADVNGSFNGTNLDQSSSASIGSGTNSEIKDSATGSTKPGASTLSGGTTVNSGGGYSSLAGTGVVAGTTDYQNTGSGNKKTGRIIPPGGTYYVKACDSALGNYSKAIEVLYAGEYFPDTCEVGDAYTYGGYEYRYKYRCENNDTWVYVASQVGWGARVLDTSKEAYNEPLAEINLEPMTKVVNTWYNCINLKHAPVLPSTITHAGRAFHKCSSLITPPALPDGVIDAGLMFAGCSSLTYTPKFPDGLGQMASMFRDCTNLTKIEKLPRLVHTLESTFRNCDSLTEAPDMSHITTKSVSMAESFAQCDNLITVATLPKNTKSMESAFNACTKLRNFTAVIPESVNNMENTFFQCYSLTGTITINSSNITNMKGCFKYVLFNTQGLTLSGSSTQLEALRNTVYE